MSKIRKKLLSQSGESFGEAMAGALIVVVSVLMLAAMISSSYKIMEKSDTRMKDYYSTVNELEGGFQQNTKWTAEDAQITFNSSQTDKLFSNTQFAIKKFSNSEFKIISYKMQ